MLFNSMSFIYIFLPSVVLLYFFISKVKQGKYIPFYLLTVSVFFYGYWDHRFLILLAFSVSMNFLLGRKLVSQKSKLILFIGLTLNLVILGYFKYYNFFVTSLNELVSSDFNVINIILPLGISFFTFSQISFIVDCFNGRTEENNFITYSLFVIFFPHVSAGPIVYHREMASQYRNVEELKFSFDNMTAGAVLFSIGLFKKTTIADNLANVVAAVFNNKEGVLDAYLSWKGSLAYTFQLYFDFSGYSDMAVGLANIFGIRIPINFLSPYKSVNIVEFWKRWHMTLSRFFRDYVFLPFSFRLSRKMSPDSLLGGDIFIYSAGIALTWSLTGIWHGAGWTFLFWGVLHAVYLILNRIIKKPKKKLIRKFKLSEKNYAVQVFYILLTFLFVHISWVYFRAPDFSSAYSVIKGMTGTNGIMLATTDTDGTVLIIFAAFIAFIMPNSFEFLADLKLGISTYGQIIKKPHPFFLHFSYNMKWALFISFVLYIGMIFVHSVQKMEFIYNDF